MKRFLKCFYFAVCMTLALSNYVSAYLDPSVMSYTIQVVAGIAVAAGAVIGIVWRRAKKKVQEKLGIDENAKKEVEDDIQIDEDDD